MSQENLERLRQSFDAFNRRDRAAWLALLDEECENFPPKEWPESAPVRGAGAIWDFYIESVEAWEEGPFEWDDPIGAGADKVMAHQRREMRGKSSGAEVVWSYWVVFTFSNAKVVRIEWFADRAEAAKALGLSKLDARADS